MMNRHNDLQLLDTDFLFDDFFDIIQGNRSSILRSDIKEVKDEYILMIDVPGFRKEDIKISLEDKYLVVSATSKKDEGKFLHRERVYGQFSRSFYVGDINKESIKASFENGVLSINIPKKENKEPEAKYIEIN